MGRVAALVALLGSKAWAEGFFVGGTEIPVDYPADVVIATDLNADGHPDAVLSHVADGQVTVILWDPAASGFSAPRVHAVGRSPASFATGDLNGDGSRDIVVVNTDAGALSVLANAGDGTFTAGADVPVPGLGPRMAQLTHLNGDEFLDLAVDLEDSRDIAVLIGDGQGGFRPEDSLPIEAKPHALSSGDFNGDGFIDLVAPVFHEGTQTGFAHWYPGRGDGTFDPMVRTDVGRSRWLRYSAPVDSDGDGRLDLVVVDLEGRVFLLRNKGGWLFGVEALPGHPEHLIDSASWNGVLQPVDLEGDGDLDLLVRIARNAEGGFRIYENTGAGSFVIRSDVLVDSRMAAPVLADFDRDGNLDALITWKTPQLLLVPGEGPGRFSIKTSVGLTLPPRGVAPFRDASGNPGVAAFGSSSVHVLVPDPSGLLRPAGSADEPELAIQDMAVANLDGLPGDELALLDLAQNKVVILPSTLDPSKGRIELSTLPLPARLASADFDRDGLADLAVTRAGALSATIFLAPGSAPPGSAFELELPEPGVAIEAADLDGDLDDDLVVASRGKVLLFHGDGRGGLAPAGFVPVALEASRIHAADLDRDGALDLVITGRTNCAVVWAAGRPAEARVTSIHAGFFLNGLDTGDMDGDGRLDIVLAAEDRGALGVVLTGADGALTLHERTYSAGTRPSDVVLADLDQDGRLDAVTANFASRAISILRGLRGSGETFRRGDADLDGSPVLTDAITILGALFLGLGPLSCPDSADANDDGELSLTDAIFLLQHLFQGGDAPPDPGLAACGPDPTADALEACLPACP